MKYLRHVILAAILAAALAPATASASAPGLQVNPLQYEDILVGKIKNGHIDVANPTDTNVTITASIRAFRQTGTNGDLSFYDDPDLEQAIKTDLHTFELGPREAIRVLFTVDPAKLPAGGTYAAIFFRTTPDEKTSSSSYVAQSANVGTLLLLRNGGTGVPAGGITKVAFPLFQFGDGLAGAATVHNAAKPDGGVAFRPALEAKVFPWGSAKKQPTGLILPGSTREFKVARPGSFIGLLPVTVTDTQTRTHRTTWVIACTGFYSWLILIVIIALIIIGLLRLPPVARRVKLPRLRRRRQPAATAPVEPVVKPVPLPEVEPELLQPVEKAEAIAPEPGTLIEPEAEPEPEKPKAHKVKLTKDEPAPQPKPKTRKRKPKTTQIRVSTDIRPKRKKSQ